MQKEFDKVKQATSIWDKSWGVIGWKSFGHHQGMLLTDTSAIHTFFVRFSLDLVFLDKEYQIVKLVRNLKPYRFSPVAWKATHTLELPEGEIAKRNLAVGDEIVLK